MESSKAAHRFVILTSGGIHAQLLSIFLGRSGFNFEVVWAHPFPPRGRGQNLIGHWLTVIDSWLRSNQLLRALANKPRHVFARKHLSGGFLNSARLIKTLQQLNPDYILIMNTGVVSDRVIRTARVGVLNAHPGLLPWVRGVDVVTSSLLEDIATGATVHFVNEGIDTGPILSRYLLPADAGDTLEQLRDQANTLALLAMIELVEKIQAGDSLEGDIQSERFELHRRRNKDELARARRIAARGGAKKLFDRWMREHPTLLDGTPLLERYRWLIETAQMMPMETAGINHGSRDPLSAL